jgi:hypothetical protein
MNREDRERMVDRVLNEALAPHDVEPRAGLEQRILANLSAQPEQRTWRWAWAPIIAVGIVLVIVAAVTLRRAPRVSTPRVAVQSRPAQPQPQPWLTQPSPVTRAIARPKPQSEKKQPVIVAVTAPDPRMDTFPSRTMLAGEEQLLRRFVKAQPGEAQMIAMAQAARQEEIQKEFQDVFDVGPGAFRK